MMRASFLLTVLGLCCVLPITVATGNAQAQERTWRFAVSLDGRHIGEHEFTTAIRDDATEVRSRARFAVDVLFVPVYRYEHSSREVWQAGCLTSIDARTLDNGKRLRVHGARTGDRFDVFGPSGAATLHGCVKTFAYWDSRFLSEQRLLNAQTGTYDAITTASRGIDRRLVAGRQREAMRHTLTTDALQIDLWYSPQGDWLGLESLTTDGRRLRYDVL